LPKYDSDLPKYGSELPADILGCRKNGVFWPKKGLKWGLFSGAGIAATLTSAAIAVY
jgi:hypothetical protein